MWLGRNTSCVKCFWSFQLNRVKILRIQHVFSCTSTSSSLLLKCSIRFQPTPQSWHIFWKAEIKHKNPSRYLPINFLHSSWKSWSNSGLHTLSIELVFVFYCNTPFKNTVFCTSLSTCHKLVGWPSHPSSCKYYFLF